MIFFRKFNTNVFDFESVIFKSVLQKAQKFVSLKIYTYITLFLFGIKTTNLNTILRIRKQLINTIMFSGRNYDKKLLRKHILLFVVVLRLFYCFIFQILFKNYYNVVINLDFRYYIM